MRLLFFLAAFAVAVLLTAPVDRWILDVARQRAATVGATLDVDALGLALPAGVRATGVSVAVGDASVRLDSIYVGVTRSFDAQACGGRVHGSFAGDGLAVELDGIDLSRCVRVGKLELEATFGGSLSIDGDGWARTPLPGDASMNIDVTSPGGVFRGALPHAGAGGAELPLGEWEFNDLVLRARMTRGEIRIDEGRAVTSGVQWELLGARLPSTGRGSGLRLDLRARQVEEGARSRALLGLMPKSSEDRDGWHRYRVTGSPDAPRVLGID